MEHTGMLSFFPLMKGSIQHILTVMNSRVLFLCNKAIMKYITHIARFYIVLGESLGRMTEQIQYSVYLGEKLMRT